MKSGSVAGVSFAYVGPSQINDLKNAPCVSANLLNVVYGSTAGAWWVYMNQNTPPFTDIHVRAAVVHAIDYAEIIRTAFNGHADLLKIGLHIDIVGINNIDELYTEQGRDPTTGECISQTSFKGGPFPMGQEFYTSDYISPDDWTQNNALSYGSANDCMSAYVNATMDQLVIDAAGDTNPTTLASKYSQITRLMYDNYTNAWLVVPQQFQILHVQRSEERRV